VACLPSTTSNGVPLTNLYGPANTHLAGDSDQSTFFDPTAGSSTTARSRQRPTWSTILPPHRMFCNPVRRSSRHGPHARRPGDCFSKEERMTFEEFITVMSGRVKDAVGACGCRWRGDRLHGCVPLRAVRDEPSWIARLSTLTAEACSCRWCGTLQAVPC